MKSLKMKSEPISAGQVGCIVMAAGHGSRLGYNKPKGCFPITRIKKKSLFQLLCEKLKAASQLYQTPLEMAFMISEDTSEEIQHFFQEHRFFGAEENSLHFFESEQWPLLDFEGSPNGFFGPSGNGCLFKKFYKSPLFANWKKKGMKHVCVISIDNPLADPFDADLINFHAQNGYEATIVGIEKKDPLEKVGMITEFENTIEIVEYGHEKGGKPLAANAGIYLFTLDFIEKAAKMVLPIYRVKKSCNGSKVANCYKLEQFIFDVLPSSRKVGVLLKPREECFAPLKNFEGEDSILSVQNALQKFEKKRLENLGLNCPTASAFELSVDFYYPTFELTKRWQSKNLADLEYIGDT